MRRSTGSAAVRLWRTWPRPGPRRRQDGGSVDGAVRPVHRPPRADVPAAPGHATNTAMLAVVNPAGQIGRAARTRGGSPPPCGRQSSGLDHGNGWLITGGFDAVEYGLDKR